MHIYNYKGEVLDMLFFKYVLLILILVCSTSIGFLLSKKYSDRVSELITFSNLVNILQNKIRFTKVPLSDAFEELSSIRSNEVISKIFYNFSKKIKTEKCEVAWNEAVEEKKDFLSLKKEDIDLIKKLGNTLGKTDLEGQMSEIDQFKILLQMQIKKAEEGRKKNEKMYKSLGTIVGLAIVIILF